MNYKFAELGLGQVFSRAADFASSPVILQLRSLLFWQ